MSPVEKQGSLVKIPNTLEQSPCYKCQSICCISLQIGEAPDIKKVEGCACPNLRPDGTCGIYDSRPEHGMEKCVDYKCGGAGAVVTELFSKLFPEFDRRKPPSTNAPDAEQKLWQARAKALDEIFQAAHQTFQRLFALQTMEAIDPDEEYKKFIREASSFIKNETQNLFNKLSEELPKSNGELTPQLQRRLDVHSLAVDISITTFNDISKKIGKNTG